MLESVVEFALTAKQDRDWIKPLAREAYKLVLWIVLSTRPRNGFVNDDEASIKNIVRLAGATDLTNYSYFCLPTQNSQWTSTTRAGRRSTVGPNSAIYPSKSEVNHVESRRC